MKYMDTLIEQGVGVESTSLRVCRAACGVVCCSATDEQQNETRHEL